LHFEPFLQRVNALYHDVSMPLNTLVPNVEYTLHAVWCSWRWTSGPGDHI